MKTGKTTCHELDADVDSLALATADAARLLVADGAVANAVPAEGDPRVRKCSDTRKQRQLANVQTQLANVQTLENKTARKCSDTRKQKTARQ